jgi:hypothetical protein
MKALKKVSDLFISKSGINLTLADLEQCEKSDKDSIAFVSRSDYNNGISAFVKKIKNISPNDSNTISVALSGSSVLASFYQTEPYYSGYHLAVLTPRQKMTPIEMMFYAFCIKNNRYRYNFGRQANKTLKNILIPAEMPKEFSTNISLDKLATVNKNCIINKTVELKTSKWKWFRYNELFILKKGKRITKAHIIDGNLPFIAAIDGNNGIRQYIDNVPLHDGNTITVNYNGSVGIAFYQVNPYWASDDVNVLYPKFKLNRFIGMFLITLIRREIFRFNYGRKWYLERMQESKIKLPVTPKGTPDWKLMDNYIKSLPFSSSL